MLMMMMMLRPTDGRGGWRLGQSIGSCALCSRRSQLNASISIPISIGIGIGIAVAIAHRGVVAIV